MDALRALRQALVDFWDESLFIVTTGFVGSLLSLFVIPIPFVLSAHYAATLAISEQRVVTFRDWLRLGRAELRFFILWALLVVFVAAVLLSNILFYARFDAAWSSAVSAIMTGLLITWLLPQPFAPAFYLRQSDRRLRVAVRNAAVFMARAPVSLLVFWISSALVVVPVVYYAWVLLPVVLPFFALLSNRLVRTYVQARPEAGEGER
jgi:hypothetical protein